MQRIRRLLSKATIVSGSALLLCTSPLYGQDYEWPSYANDQGSSKYADLDQISDTWEIAHFGNMNSTDDQTDSDNDGVSNMYELAINKNIYQADKLTKNDLKIVTKTLTFNIDF
mgnify:CR=1 FL=1